MLSATLKQDKSQRQLVRNNYVFQFTIAMLSVILGTLGFVTFSVLQEDQLGQFALMQGYYLAQVGFL
jgi:hypothetical protein